MNDQMQDRESAAIKEHFMPTTRVRRVKRWLSNAVHRYMPRWFAWQWHRSPLGDFPFQEPTAEDVKWAKCQINMITAEMQQKVAAAFTVIPRVVYIFHYLRCSADTFPIFTDTDQYDSALMDELLDVELGLIEEYPYAEFIYIPAPGGTMPIGCIPKYATCLYPNETLRTDGTYDHYMYGDDTEEATREAEIGEGLVVALESGDLAYGSDPKVDYTAWIRDKAYLRWIRERLKDIEWITCGDYERCPECGYPANWLDPKHEDYCWLKVEIDKL